MITLEATTPIRNHLIVQFLDGQAGGEFVDKTKSGILLTSIVAEQGTTPRWATVIKCGPECSEAVKPGTKSLIEQGMWSVGFMFKDDKRYWRTDEAKIIGTE